MIPQIAAWIVALVLAVAGASKGVDPRAFQLGLAAYGVQAAWVAALIACVLPVLELVTAGLLSVPRWRRIGAGFAIVLVMIFLAALAGRASEGLDASCGCFGPWSVPVPLALAIDALLLALAIVAVRSGDAGWPWSRRTTAHR